MITLSYYDSNDYEYSFYQRTIKNLEFIQNRVKEEKAQGKKDHEIQDAFEVTQLINSFVGLLIIPRQKCFINLPEDDRDFLFPYGSDADKLFWEIKEGYGLRPNFNRRKITLKYLILKLRNAVAHDHLKILPVSPGKDGIITGIVFSDVDGFELSLSVNDTEILVRALADKLLSYYPKKSQVSMNKQNDKTSK